MAATSRKKPLRTVTTVALVLLIGLLGYFVWAHRTLSARQRALEAALARLQSAPALRQRIAAATQSYQASSAPVAGASTQAPTAGSAPSASSTSRDDASGKSVV